MIIVHVLSDKTADYISMNLHILLSHTLRDVIIAVHRPTMYVLWANMGNSSPRLGPVEKFNSLFALGLGPYDVLESSKRQSPQATFTKRFTDNPNITPILRSPNTRRGYGLRRSGKWAWDNAILYTYPSTT